MKKQAHARIPGTWTQSELGQIADIQLGKMLDKRRGLGTPLRYLRNVNVRWEHIDTSDLLTMPFQEDELERYSLEKGDVLICEGGEPGRSAVLEVDDPTLKYQKALHRVRMFGGIHPRWLVLHLYYDAKRGGLAKHLTGTTISHLPLEAARAYRLRIAPLREQNRIVGAIDSYFSRLDDAVATLERAERNLKRYRASVLKAAVEGRLVPTEAELAHAEGRDYEPASVLLQRILAERRRRWEEAELARLTAAGKTPKNDRWKARYEEPVGPDAIGLPDLPEGWCWATCDQLLARLQTGPFGSSLHKSDYVEGGTPVINPQHLRRYRIEPSGRVAVSTETVERLSAFRLRAGDVVLGRRGEMGRCALVGPREDGWLLGTGSLALRLAEGVDRRFFTWALRNERSVRTLEDSSVGTTMTNLNQEILLALLVPLPPLAEQGRIAAEIERQFSVADAVEGTVTPATSPCASLRQSILKWAFEGRLVDQDPMDEPAAVLLERIRAEREAAPLKARRVGPGGRPPRRTRRGGAKEQRA